MKAYTITPNWRTNPTHLRRYLKILNINIHQGQSEPLWLWGMKIILEEHKLAYDHPGEVFSLRIICHEEEMVLFLLATCEYKLFVIQNEIVI